MKITLKLLISPYTSVEQQSLQFHQRTHFNIRDYKCDICQLTYKKKSNLTVHFQRKHSGVTTKCMLCEFESSVHNVQVHLIRKHKITGYSWDAEKSKFINKKE